MMAPEDRRTRAQRAALGGLIWALAFVAADRLGLVTAVGIERLLDLDEGWALWAATLAGGGLALTRARVVVPGAAALVFVLYALVVYTPLTRPLVQSWSLYEAPSHADAVVVLSSGVTHDAHLSSNGVTRLLHGASLVREGYAPLLVRTDISPPLPDDTADALDVIGQPPLEIALVGPVASTRDEALATLALLRERGLHRVIVVTQPLHERRAAAAFRAVGLDVVACSSPERSYSIDTLTQTNDRRLAFRDWVTELAAWTLYSARGWVR